MLDYIFWNPDPIIAHLGSFALHWYSMCWLLGLLFGYLIVKRLYRDQRVPDELFDPLFIYVFVGVLIGGRLGHCLFYQPDYFLSSGKHFVEMLLPIHFMENGGWRCTGYAGLASHGGVIGILVALYLYNRKTHVNVWHVLDNVALASPITSCFIRLGNLMNSEIIGKPTDVPWAFIFAQVDMQPRHPGQLYESLFYFCCLFVGWVAYRRYKQRVGTGFFFGLILTLIFTFRFFVEFLKDIQEPFEANMPLDMGQLLSIPLILVGLLFLFGQKWTRHLGTRPYEENSYVRKK